MEINKQRLLNEFLELVQIDSASKDERLMADALKPRLEALGFTVTEDDAGEKIGGQPAISSPSWKVRKMPQPCSSARTWIGLSPAGGSSLWWKTE